MYKPYIISSPDFHITSGGIRVMWGLFGWLLAKGQIVYMNRYPTIDRIAIYPEIDHGNKIGAKKVIRYILNTPGLMGKGIPGTDTFIPGPDHFDPEDELYYFSRVFGETDEDHYLFLPIINTHLFKDQKKNRTKECYFVGKGINTHLHPEDAIEINRTIAQDQAKLADMLNECTVMTCYDNLSAMMDVARLCGCAVSYHGLYPKETLEKYEPGMNGIDGDLDVFDFRNHYLSMINLFSDKLDQFIDHTQA